MDRGKDLAEEWPNFPTRNMNYILKSNAVLTEVARDQRRRLNLVIILEGWWVVLGTARRWEIIDSYN